MPSCLPSPDRPSFDEAAACLQRFREAARERQVTKAAVSQQVQGSERYSGVRG